MKDLESLDKHIECFICGRDMQQITSTHTRQHGITSREYMQKFNLKKSDLIAPRLKEIRRRLILERSKDDPDFFRKISIQGNEQRKTYWSDPVNKKKKAILQRSEMNNRFKDKNKLKQQREMLDRAREKQEYLSSVSKECPQCHKRYTASKIHSIRAFKNKIFCSNTCLWNYLRDNQLGVKDIKALRKKLIAEVNKTLIEP